MSTTPAPYRSHDEVPSAVDMAAFDNALRTRRKLVADYLESWPGSADFNPAEIRDALYSYVRYGGKGLRPALLLLSCSAAGGDESRAVPAAAAVEIFHIWTLVHDDIIDRDATRRGNLTVHARYSSHAHTTYGLSAQDAEHYGLAVAILTGDLQQSWSYAMLTELANRGVSAQVTLKLVKRMSEWLTPRLLEGEMLDVQFAAVPPENLSQDDVLNMLARKTAALLEYAAWAGAVIGCGERPDTEQTADKLGRFASLCGTAFQLQDDILGLTADEKLLGKPVGSDIREGKRTLVVSSALARLDRDGQRQLLTTLGNRSASAMEVAATLSLIRSSGAFEDIRELAYSFISQALAILDELPSGESVTLLRSWASYILSRQY